jgi:hypothetical protein
MQSVRVDRTVDLGTVLVFGRFKDIRLACVRYLPAVAPSKNHDVSLS